MVGGRELEIKVELFGALVNVLGHRPTTPEPVVVVSVYLSELARSYGLSESVDEDPLERAAAVLGRPAMAFVAQYLPQASASNADSLRERLHAVLVQISRDTAALRALNKSGRLSPVEMLTAAQIYWNLEGDERRPLLPIRSGQPITTANGETVPAALKVPEANRDFAEMTWTARINQKGAHLSSGQAFRNLGARMAVLAAQLIVADTWQTPPSLGEAKLVLDPEKKSASIVWPDTEPVSGAPGGPVEDEGANTGRAVDVVPDMPGAPDRPLRSPGRVLVGDPAEVGGAYQRRGFDDQIERLWADRGDRRVWLRGGPGLGKSYAARRVMQDAVADDSPQREELLIWVDSADAHSLTHALSEAVDRMPHLGLGIDKKAPDRDDRQARDLLKELATSTWRWLIVLDNADAASLISARLLPPGGNPNGRVLLTTLSQDHRITGHGRVVSAATFTPKEAKDYLRSRVDPKTGGPAPLARAGRADKKMLATAVGYHPLALSIAAATIVANAMEISDWIEEFNATPRMDEAADAPDPGGYRHLIAATWRLALEKASRGLPPGLVERAAAVAAVLDPDGHPTWLWDRQGLATWVSGGSALERHHGRPVVVQRIIDHGIVELSGPSWKRGELEIHQLAARAVRELMPANELTDLGKVIVDEWLLGLAEDWSRRWSGLGANMRTLTTVVALPDPARVAAAALLGLTEPSPEIDRMLSLSHQLGTYELLAGPLERAGRDGRVHLAHWHRRIGSLQIGDGLLDDGRESLTRAATTFQSLIQDRGTDDDDRAGYLAQLGHIQDELGHHNEAQASYTQSAEIYQRLTSGGLETGATELLRLLESLSDVQDELGQPAQRDATRARRYETLKRIADLDPDSGEVDRFAMAERAHLLQELGEHQYSRGQSTAAKATLSRAAEYSRRAGSRPSGLLVGRLVTSHIESGEWAEAEDLLTSLVQGQATEDGQPDPDDLLRLACVQQHRGRPEDAATNLAQAADIYQKRRPKARTAEDEATRWLDLYAPHALLSKKWDAADELYAGYIELVEKRADASPGDHEEDLADGYLHRGLALYHQGQFDFAADMLEKSVKILQTLADLNPDNVKAQSQLADCLTALGFANDDLGRFDEADAYFKRTVDVRQVMADRDPANLEKQEWLARSLLIRSFSQRKLGHTENAEAYLLRSLNIRQALADLNPDHTDAQEKLAEVLSALGDSSLQFDRLDEAAGWYRRSLEIHQKAAERDRRNVDAQREFAEVLKKLGASLFLQGNPDEAEPWFTRSVDCYQELAGHAPGNHNVERDLARVLMVLAAVYHQLGRLDEAINRLGLSINTHQLLVDLDPGHGDEKLLFACFKGREELLRILGRTDEADADRASAADLAERYPELDDGTAD